MQLRVLSKKEIERKMYPCFQTVWRREQGQEETEIGGGV